MYITPIFHRYFTVRFLKYLLVINIFFVFLFNFIEFFEKLSHAKNSSVYDILYFLSLNIAPTFFEQLPISCWLTSCLLIRELHVQQEIDTLTLLGFSFRKFFKLFFIVGIGLTCTSFIINEYFVTNITFKAEQYKMEHFKQISTRTLVSTWMVLDQKTFCYFSALNSQLKEGKNLFLIYLTPQFTIQKTISAPSFSINTNKQQITLPEVKVFDVEHNSQKKTTNFVLASPSFFSQIHLHYETPSVINLIKSLARGHNIIPSTISNDILGQLLKRLTSYLLLIIYPMLTFGLFGLFWRRQTFRWMVIFTPYPLLTVTSMLSDRLLHNGINSWLAYTPYLAVFIGLLTLYRLLKQ